MKLVVATHNRDKIKEIKAILKDLLRGDVAKDVGFDEEVIEDGVSFPANALIKAKRYIPIVQMPMSWPMILVYVSMPWRSTDLSSRFAGEETDYPTKFKYLWIYLLQ